MTMKQLPLIIILMLLPALHVMGGEDRNFPETLIFVNNHLFGETNGCTTGLGVNGKGICGFPGAASEITWEFIKTMPEGDVYRFVRVFPKGILDSTTEVKEVIYKGEKLEIWNDSNQRIILKPEEKDADDRKMLPAELSPKKDTSRH